MFPYTEKVFITWSITMYFAILGKNRELSLKELEFAQVSNLHSAQNQKIVLFDSADENKLSQLAGIIKRWKIVNTDLDQVFSSYPDKRILWVADKNQGINLKKQYKLKRFKQTDLLHTDKEVKQKGIELIRITHQRGLVLGYQNIQLYEVADFEKPARSMQMGMMPAKLTHTMLNIARTQNPKQSSPLIYDPFVWSGTTGFLANNAGLDFIGSDLKLSFAEQNQKWRLSRKENQNKNLTFDLFLHDATKPFDNPDLFNGKTPLIVTEGRLWPVIKLSTTPDQIKEYQRRVKNVYVQRIEQMGKAFSELPNMVFTIPIYLWYENFIEQAIMETAYQAGFRFSSIDELYKRDQHKVARKIIILTSQ